MATNNISAADKQKALEAAIAQAERQFGKGSVMRLGEATRMQVSAIPTGSTALDAALDLGFGDLLRNFRDLNWHSARVLRLAPPRPGAANGRRQKGPGRFRGDQ